MRQFIDILAASGAWLLLPIFGLVAYDKIVLAPKRPTDENGEPVRGPHIFGFANYLLVGAILLTLKHIGPQGVSALWSGLIGPLSYLALPLVLIAVYDIWILEPKRPRAPSGRPMPPPWYIAAAKTLAYVAVIAVVVRIGVNVVFDFVKDLAEPLSYFALPVGLWCAIDSWFLSPRRQIAAGVVDAPVPVITRVAYFALPVLVVAMIVRMVTAETLDFSLVLLELSLVTGLIWGIDHFFVRKTRAVKIKDGGNEIAVPEPGTVDYARSFFPVAMIVLVVRAFIFEPFRIPSDSMMPTLLDGDFIVVNKYSYGLRWPVINEKFLDIGTPQRGDVVVFRHPPHPEVNFIKRLVGLPGDRVEVRDDHLVINGESVPLEDIGLYQDNCYSNVRLSEEKLGENAHQVMRCRSERGLSAIRDLAYDGRSLPETAACDRKRVAADTGGWACLETPPEAGPDRGDKRGQWRVGDDSVAVDVVPAGYYLMIGDNRDNSDDSRGWGLVPEKNLVGKATRIWFNFDSQRPTNKIVNVDRIGKKIE